MQYSPICNVLLRYTQCFNSLLLLRSTKNRSTMDELACSCCEYLPAKKEKISINMHNILAISLNIRMGRNKTKQKQTEKLQKQFSK